MLGMMCWAYIWWMKLSEKYVWENSYLPTFQKHKQHNSQSPNYDKLYKLRLLLDYLNKKIFSIPTCEWPATYEHFCASYGWIHIKVHMKDKSHKFSYKLIELCVHIGFAHSTEIYCRKVNDHKFWKTEEPNMGASGGIVIWLYRDIARHENKILCSDRYYTPLLLAVYLFK
jgi:hypothetical protein